MRNLYHSRSLSRIATHSANVTSTVNAEQIQWADPSYDWIILTLILTYPRWSNYQQLYIYKLIAVTSSTRSSLTILLGSSTSQPRSCWPNRLCERPRDRSPDRCDRQMMNAAPVNWFQNVPENRREKMESQTTRHVYIYIYNIYIYTKYIYTKYIYSYLYCLI